MAGENEGKDDGKAVAQNYKHEEVDGYFEPSQGCKSTVKEQERELGECQTWDVNDRCGHNELSESG